jgi:hypothetical protein
MAAPIEESHVSLCQSGPYGSGDAPSHQQLVGPGRSETLQRHYVSDTRHSLDLHDDRECAQEPGGVVMT